MQYLETASFLQGFNRGIVSQKLITPAAVNALTFFGDIANIWGI